MSTYNSFVGESSKVIRKKSVNLTVNYDTIWCFHAIPLRGILLVHDECSVQQLAKNGTKINGCSKKMDFNLHLRVVDQTKERVLNEIE